MTLLERIMELKSVHGSLRAAGRVVKIDAAYLSRLCNGTKRGPSARTLRKLGLRKVVDYERI